MPGAGIAALCSIRGVCALHPFHHLLSLPTWCVLALHCIPTYLRTNTPAYFLLTHHAPIARVIFPIMSTFLSKKLKNRIGLFPEVDGRVDKLFEYLPPAAVPAEVGGTAPFDMEAWAASMLK